MALLRRQETVLEHTGQRVALAGALTATDEGARRRRDILEDAHVSRGRLGRGWWHLLDKARVAREQPVLDWAVLAAIRLEKDGREDWTPTRLSTSGARVIIVLGVVRAGQMEQLELCRELFGGRVVTLAVLVWCSGVGGRRPPRKILRVGKRDLFRTKALCLSGRTAKGVKNVGGHIAWSLCPQVVALMG